MNKAFSLAASKLLGSTNVSLFALVDGLQYERYFGEGLEPKNDAVVPLFDKYPDSRVAFAGPWLICLNRDMALRESLMLLEKQLPSVSWLVSSLPLSDLVMHLQQYMNAELPDGRVALLRLQDPRVQLRLGEQLEEYQHAEITKNIAEWFSSVEGKVYSVKEKEFVC